MLQLNSTHRLLEHVSVKILRTVELRSKRLGWAAVPRAAFRRADVAIVNQSAWIPLVQYWTIWPLQRSIKEPRPVPCRWPDPISIDGGVDAS